MGAKRKRKCNHDSTENELILLDIRKYMNEVIIRKATLNEVCKDCEHVENYIVAGGILFNAESERNS